MSEEFAGKVALVTGASSGMGRATALAFAAAGAQVVLADVAIEAGEQVAGVIRDAGGEAAFVRTDVSQSDEVAALTRAALDRFGRLDCAVNAAAIESETTMLADSDEAGFDRVIAINLRSVFLCMKYEIQAMLPQGSGAIVNIASVNSFRPQPRQSAYTAAKHGVIGLTKVAAIEYAGSGIRVNAVAPGAIDTPMLRGSMAARGTTEADVVERLSLIGRLGQPTEIADAVLWLCSDRATFVMGHVLAVDGGYLAR